MKRYKKFERDGRKLNYIFCKKFRSQEKAKDYGIHLGVSSYRIIKDNNMFAVYKWSKNG